jgi:hypothetical protein
VNHITGVDEQRQLGAAYSTTNHDLANMHWALLTRHCLLKTSVHLPLPSSVSFHHLQSLGAVVGDKPAHSIAISGQMWMGHQHLQPPSTLPGCQLHNHHANALDWRSPGQHLCCWWDLWQVLMLCSSIAVVIAGITSCCNLNCHCS